MAVRTYKDFLYFYDFPNTIVTLFYALTLLLFGVAVGISKCCIKKSCCKSCARAVCCPCMTEGLPGNQNDFCSIVCNCIQHLSAWMVRIIFGSEGVSEKKEEVTGHGGSTQVAKKAIYINGKEMKAIDVNILGAIIVCFGLLVAITAYNTYLLEVTNTCSEDPAIHCFPLLTNDSEIITPKSDLATPITNCSEWTESSISPYVTFQCFHYVFNANAALAVAGGLLALFTFVMRTTISIFIKLFECCCHCKHAYIGQYTLAIVVIPVDVAIAIVVMAFQVPGLETDMLLFYHTLQNMEFKSSSLQELLHFCY